MKQSNQSEQVRAQRLKHLESAERRAARRLLQAAALLLKGTWFKNFETIDQIPGDYFNEPDGDGNHGTVKCPSCGSLIKFRDDIQDPVKCSCGRELQVIDTGGGISKSEQEFLQPNRYDVYPTGARRHVDTNTGHKQVPEVQDIVTERYKGYR